MRGRAALTVVLLVVSFAACVDSNGGFEAATVEISQDARTVHFQAEVAATGAQRQRGLMGRESLAADAGMLFLFPAKVALGFWMKDTLIPLDIAFIDGERIVEIRTMVPCTKDPCPLTTPSSAYDAALEVNEGSFTRAGITRGAHVRFRGALPKVS